MLTQALQSSFPLYAEGWDNLAKCFVDVTGLPLQFDGPLGRVSSHRTVSLVLGRLNVK